MGKEKNPMKKNFHQLCGTLRNSLSSDKDEPSLNQGSESSRIEEGELQHQKNGESCFHYPETPQDTRHSLLGGVRV